MCARAVESDGDGAWGRMMPAFSNPKVANRITSFIVTLYGMLIFSSVSRHHIHQCRHAPQIGKICSINQNYGPPGPSLLWYRHFFPTSVIPSAVSSFSAQQLPKASQRLAGRPAFVWRTVTHSREGGGGADEERDKSKLHLWGLGIGLLSSRDVP